MLIDGLGIGVPYKTFRGAGETLNQSSLYLPLKSTIVPSKGTSTPTFTRATAAWSFDNEGKLNLNIPSGCARFKGGRLVRNYVSTTSATLAVAATNTVTLSRAETVTFSMGAGTGTATFSGTSGATGTLTASPSGRTEVTKTCTAGTFIITASVATLVDIQVEIVSGQTDQTPSEYVSVGVLSSPYYGAGVDGCKWFPTNKDGSAIPSSTLEGYLAEPQRTNNCLWGRNLAGMISSVEYTTWKWVNQALSGATELISNVDFTAGISGWTAYNGATLAHDTGRLKITTPGGAFAGAYATVTCVTGNTYTVTYDHIAGDASVLMAVGTSSGNTALGYVANSGTTSRTISFIATQSTMYVSFYHSIGTTVGKFAYIDNVSVKESAIQVTTATGIDNVANSASRLIAAANDATLLQLLTAATGTRTLSAYIKRVSGTGTISLTRDGGTGWTDITSSLVTGSWVLVQLTSDVGANPTVGIKMGTSGDVIDVDCVQDENGAWATSPILTTTAAVTRNGDILSYASAFNVAQGSALCSVKTAVALTLGDIRMLGGDSGSAKLMYLNSGSSRNEGRIFDGTTEAISTGLSLLTGIRKRASRWGSGLKSCSDGSLGTGVAFDGSMGTVGTLYVGCSQLNAEHISGPIREVHIWPTPLTDTQMKQVTT